MEKSHDKEYFNEVTFFELKMISNHPAENLRKFVAFLIDYVDELTSET